MAYSFNKETVLKAIQNSRGITEIVAKKLGCSWHTAQTYMNKWEETRSAVLDEQERSLDFAEGVILDSIKNKDVQTAKWYLKMKGQSRGYIETQETTIKNADPLNINFNGGDMTAEEIAAQDNVEIGGSID